MSAESGLRTFRDGDGLWEEYRIEDVATPNAWEADKEKVMRFYNERRKQILAAKPNEGHQILADLQEKFDVQIITQNIDDLHERGGAKKVLHLHGEIVKSRSSRDPNLIFPVKGWEMKPGEKCPLGSELRPHIVWFGEQVPEMDYAMGLCSEADIFVTIGTSLLVYPAAGLIHAAPAKASKYLIDPGNFDQKLPLGIIHYCKRAVEGIRLLREDLEKLYI